MEKLGRFNKLRLIIIINEVAMSALETSFISIETACLEGSFIGN
jgi:hypothetical protein